MDTKKMWCSTCRAVVSTVIKEATTSVAVPLVMGALGGAISAAAGKSKTAVARGLIGAAVTGVGAAVAQELIPQAQELVCGRCNCPDLSEPPTT